MNYIWKLKNKETGNFYPEFSYPTRAAARKAAKGRRFGGKYTPTKFFLTMGRSTMAAAPTQKWKTETVKIQATRYVPAGNKIYLKASRTLGKPLHKATPVHKA